jgi:hypothetical protein
MLCVKISGQSVGKCGAFFNPAFPLDQVALAGRKHPLGRGVMPSKESVFLQHRNNRLNARVSAASLKSERVVKNRTSVHRFPCWFNR